MNFSMRGGLLLLCACSLIGCQSTRPNFSFQPAPLALTLPAISAETSPAPVSTTHTVATEPLPTVAPPLRHAVRHTKRPTTAARVQLIKMVPQQLLKRPLAHRRHLLARPQAPAESGLGLTVLGLLGMVAVAVGLIGLAISGGGLGWIIVAGAGALAVLMAWIDPSGR